MNPNTSDTGPVNVVMLMSDEHNPFVSSVYGHPRVHTPNMDRLAARGTVYENAYCPTPLCQPCRTSFAAGRRVHDVQCYNNCRINVPAYRAYGGVLDEQGVYSVNAGKLDAGQPEDDLGFTELLKPHDRNPRGDEHIRRQPVAIRPDGADRANGFGVHENAWATDRRIMAESLHWLRNTGAGLDRPWSLAINLHAPHFPHYCSEELWQLYPDGGDLPLHGRDSESAAHPFAEDLRQHFDVDGFTEAQVRGLRRGYLACVSFVDAQIGRLLDALDELGLAERTAVIYCSDHGEMLGKFGMWWKCSLYEDSVRVPVIAAGPGFAQGQRVRTPVDLLDVQASLFAATGARRPEAWVGQPLQTMPVDDPHRVAFSEYHGHGTRASGYMVRRGDWKLIHYIGAPDQLFNLADDPDELQNLAEREPAKRAELEAELHRICDPQREQERAEQFITGQIESLGAAGTST